MTPQTQWPTAGGEIQALLQDPRSGAVFLNPQIQQQHMHWLFADSQAGTASALLPNSDQQDMGWSPQLVKGDQGDFEGANLVSTSTGRFAARIYDSFLDRWLSNGLVPNELMFGAIEYPGWLAESTFIPASTTMQIQVRNLTLGDNTVVLQIAGRRLMGCGPRMQVWNAYRTRRTHPYWLTFDLGPEQNVAANTTSTFIMTVPAGVQFLAETLMDDTSRTIADGTTTVADYTVRIFNGNSGETLIGARNQAPVSINAVAARSRNVTGVQNNRLRAVGNPYKLPFRHLFAEKTQVTVEVTNANAFTIVVRLAWHGKAIYADQCPAGVDPLRMLEQPTGYMPVPQGPNCGPLQCGTGAPPAPAPAPQASPYAVPAPQGYVQPASIAQQGVQQPPPVRGYGYGAGAHWGY